LNANNSIKLLYFASLGEQLGLSEEAFPLTQACSVQQLCEQLSERGPQWKELLCATKIKCAVNHTISNQQQQIKPNDEVAFFPPVTGG